jgi:hypothetical protein
MQFHIFAAPPCLRLTYLNKVNYFFDLALGRRIIRLPALVAYFTEAQGMSRGNLVGFPAGKASDKPHFDFSHVPFPPFSL